MISANEWIENLKDHPDCRFVSTPVTVDLIEAIQRDALSDPLANESDQRELEMARSIAMNERIRADQLYDQMVKMRDRWHQTRNYLRAANKGAERSNMAMKLAHQKLKNYRQSDKRYEEKEKWSMESRVWEWLALSDEDLRLRIGEMTSQEIRNCKALLRALLGTKKLSHRP
jgi:t-SNARE complex subunit (syntaxin)